MLFWIRVHFDFCLPSFVRTWSRFRALGVRLAMLVRSSFFFTGVCVLRADLAISVGVAFAAFFGTRVFVGISSVVALTLLVLALFFLDLLVMKPAVFLQFLRFLEREAAHITVKRSFICMYQHVLR